MAKLLYLHAFYRNNEPTGVGITLTYEAGDIDVMFDLLKDSYDA